ncbi:ABC transporter [Micromonospora pattaloongensis]|uniref:ABC transporter n=1 Tax=Micromonospora pattaloongensis TaxID=405436 RepID=A0A1H3QTL5_9ACTN|nr:ATP-binding cassette domain-containing protein [Micromonospora pattaloongensis]SDZ16932.1 ABC transporter [Micromonospora pattaloongensis]
MIATLQLDGLTVAAAMEPVTLRVAAGDAMALVAPPAIGTTVARVTAGLTAPLSGRIRVGERDVTDLPPPKRQIGYVPAGAALLPHLTVRKNIEYGQLKRARVHAVAHDWLATVIERLELGPTLGLRPHLLSDAQRFRAALARAAACLPEVLVIDLPVTAGGTDRLTELLPRVAPPDSAGVAALVCSADPALLGEISAQVTVEVTGRPATGSG